MTLWDHLSREQRKKIAETIEPPAENRPVFLEYFISVTKEGSVRELFSLRQLDSLVPFTDEIRSIKSDSASRMRIVLVPPMKVRSIWLRNMDGKRWFPLPQEVLERVVTELGLFDGTAPEALLPLDW
jgi:hypothetical protein